MVILQGAMRGFKSTTISGIEVGYGTKEPGGHAYHSYRGVQEVNGGS